MPLDSQYKLYVWGTGVIALALSISLTAGAMAGPPQGKSSAKPPVKATGTTSASIASDNTPLTEEQKIVHVLNRLGFGPRPGDVEKVRQMGLRRYIDLQLEPDKIDDSAVENKLGGLTLLKQSSEELAQTFYNRQKGIVKLAKAKQKMDEKNTASETMQNTNGATAPPLPADMTPQQKAAQLREMYQSMTPEEKDALQKFREAQQKIREGGIQLAFDKTVRAAESERQLQEVLVDFWSNHFNIDISKGACAVLKITDERDVVRKNAFGKFRDLLEASAKSPAMLFYLDNAQSVAPQTLTSQQQRRQDMFLARLSQSGNPNAEKLIQAAKNRRKGGINENYAREIMELHTLGVDGGYTQQDVQEVARCLTGWGIDRQTGTFEFNVRRHDQGEKIVLGHTIPANGGIRDGGTVLDLLASHPSTMRHVSYQLCQRFVCDQPPASLVDKCVATWKRTDGDLKEIYRTIFTSPEFYSRAAYRQKIKSPFEYAISSVRALGGTFELPEQIIDGGMRLGKKGNGPGNAVLARSVVGQVTTMGQQLYRCQPPTGWTEDSRKWVSSGALIARLNFALTLAGNKLADIHLNPGAMPQNENPPQLVNSLADRILQGEISPSTRATLLKQATATPQDATVAANTDVATRLVALVLGSPEFQRR